jgi:glycosyltransferase involved in cell wall biosynthesis
MLLSDKRIAFVHFCLVNMRGGERVLDFFCDLFPQADIFTLVADAKRVPARIKQHKITTSFIQKLPFGVKKYQQYLPLHPLAVEQFDLSGYDLVISFQSGVLNHVIVSPETCHLCYCHTPVRYLWNMYHEYKKDTHGITRLLWPLIANYMRQLDYVSAQRVDYFMANSHNVQKRIRRYYRRDSEVLYPPLAFDLFHTGASEDFYLVVGQLNPYKKVDLAVQAFNRLNKRLVIIGDGPQRKKLETMAGPGITFLGRETDAVLTDYYARCRALVFPGEEDFGLAPLEAMASGKPVLAFGRGGALETVQPGRTGVLFREQTVNSLIEAVSRLEESHWDADDIRNYARQFSHENVREKYRDFIFHRYAEFLGRLER